jgi:hypothetical protein
MKSAVIERTNVGTTDTTSRPASQTASVGLWVLAAALAAWALIDPRFRNGEGYATARICVPVSGAIAAAVWGWAITQGAARFGAWFALAATGQAASLALVDAGPALKWQHYWPIPLLVEKTGWLPLGVLLVQAAIVAKAVTPSIGAFRRWLGGALRPWQQIAIAFVFVMTSATLSRSVTIYASELVFASLVQALHLATLALMVWAIPSAVATRWKQRWIRLSGSDGSDSDAAGRVDRVVLGAAVAAAVAAAVIGATIYERHPHIPDEVVYLYHARYFAEGQLTMPLPPARGAFDLDLMTFEPDRWFSPVPPAWPAVLAIGVLFGQPWLVNPILGGLNILLAYGLVRRIYDRRTGRYTALLMAAAAWPLFLNMSLMPHTWTMTCSLMAMYAMARARTGPGAAFWSLMAGAASGVISLIRPLEALAVAALLGLWGLGVRGLRAKAGVAIPFVAGAAAIGALNAPYNKLLTGSATSFPLMAYSDKYYGANANMLGFGANRGLGWGGLDPFPGHGLRDVLVNANLNLFSVNIDLFGWSIGSILLAALLIAGGAKRQGDGLMIGTLAMIIGLHSFYWFSGGPDFGARYWYLVLLPAVVLTVRGGQALTALVGDADGTRARVGIAIVAVTFLAVVNFVPWRALDKYRHFRGMRGDIVRLARDFQFGRSLVLVRGERHTDFPSAANYNPIDLQADEPIYAWDRDREARVEVLRAYIDRPVWIVDGPTVTNGPFRMVEGPVPARELLAREGETSAP